MHPNKITHNLVVVLVNYNSADDTFACVESIRHSETSNPFIIIVDNSTPAQQQLDELVEKYDGVHLIYTHENVGFGHANNIGIDWANEHLDFEFIVLLNNDTIITPNALSKLTMPFEHDPAIGVTTGKIMYYDRQDIVWYGGADLIPRKGWPRITDMNQIASAEGANKARQVSFISGCLMVFSKASIARIKGFDPAIFMYCEDLELSIRAKKLGYILFYEPSSVIYHKVHGSMGGQPGGPKNLQPGNPNANFLFFHMRSNQYLTMRKHLSGADFFWFRIFFWLKFIYTNLKMMLHGKFSILKTSVRTIKRIIKTDHHRYTEDA